MIVAFTGHRPDKLAEGDYKKIIWAIEWELRGVHNGLGPPASRVISGMAPGVDILGLTAANLLSLPATAAIPWIGHGTSPAWAKRGVEDYIRYLEMCDRHEVICEGEEYRPWFYQKRNEWMVDNCDLLLAVWDGSDGGTANCVRYARKVGREIRYYQWESGTFGGWAPDGK